MHKLLSALTIALITLVSCNNGSTTVEPQRYNFSSTDNAVFEKVEINEIIKPLDFIPTQKYLIILHEAEFGEDQLYVYDLNSLKFLYSFAKKGSGPSETIALDVFRNSGNHNYVDLIDQSSYKRLRYELNDSDALLLQTSHLDLPNMGPLQETWWVNDSVIIFSTLERELLTFNIASDSIVDRFRIASLFNGVTDDTNVRSLCGFHFSVQENKLIIGLKSVNKLVTGRIYNNKIEIIPQDEALFQLPENTNRVYYTYVSQLDSLIIAQYYGREINKFLPKLGIRLPDFTHELGIFNSKLEPRYNIIPNIQSPRFYADSKNRRIICWDQKSDFEYIYFLTIPQ